MSRDDRPDARLLSTMIRPLTADRRVCIVGAGPVGCLLALLWSRQGVKVDLLESRPLQVRRLGGEWLHPAAVDILRNVGVLPQLTSPSFPTGRGFTLFPEDGSEPIALPYPVNRVGLSVEHATLVNALRQAATTAPGVDYIPHARLTGIHDHTAEFVDGNGVERELSYELIVGADGRGSQVRRSALGMRRPRMTSCMAGLLLHDIEMPHEGFGHVFVGPPGPVLAYRIAPQVVRLCVDVPAQHCIEPNLNAFLQAHYPAYLPRPWHDEFRRVLAAGEVVWAQNSVESRATYGIGPVRLVGDAVGCLHPITASGMTLGFQDAVCLATEPTLAEYRDQRRAACHVPQALASSLYAALSRHDESSQMIRQSIYRHWRQGSAQRDDTVQLLCAEESRIWQFRRIFFKIAAMGLESVVRDIVVSQQWRQPTTAWRRLQGQVRWLDATTTLLDSSK